MDRNVVCRALEEVHNIDGSEYLEKIVQIPFEIPTLMKPQIREIFLAKLNDTIKDILMTLLGMRIILMKFLIIV